MVRFYIKCSIRQQRLGPNLLIFVYVAEPIWRLLCIVCVRWNKLLIKSQKDPYKKTHPSYIYLNPRKSFTWVNRQISFQGWAVHNLHHKKSISLLFSGYWNNINHKIHRWMETNSLCDAERSSREWVNGKHKMSKKFSSNDLFSNFRPRRLGEYFKFTESLWSGAQVGQKI